MYQTRAPLVLTQLQKLGQATHIPQGYQLSEQELQQCLHTLAKHGVPPDVAYPSIDTLVNSRYQRKIRGILASYLFEGDGPLSGDQPCKDEFLGLTPERNLRLPARISDGIHLDEMLHLIARRLEDLRQCLSERIDRSCSQSAVFKDQTAAANFRLPQSMRQSIAIATRQARTRQHQPDPSFQRPEPQ